MTEPLIFIRNDDPAEKVFIQSQERTPNGTINFIFVEPESARDKTGRLEGNEFHRLYTRENQEPTPWPPPRPISISSKEEWRAYALYLEQERALDEDQDRVGW